MLKLFNDFRRYVHGPHNDGLLVAIAAARTEQMMFTRKIKVNRDRGIVVRDARFPDR